MRHARVSSPAARLSTRSAPPPRTRSLTTSSKTCVRTIIGQAMPRPCGSDATMFSPFTPARRRAHGSRKRASGRSVSIAR